MNPDTLTAIFDILELSDETRSAYLQKMDAFIVEKGMEAFMESFPEGKRDSLLTLLEAHDRSEADISQIASQHLTPLELAEAQEALARGMEKAYIDYLNVLTHSASDEQRKAIEGLLK